MLTRRDFLKLSGLALGSLALRPHVFGYSSKPPDATGLVRVAGTKDVQIYDQPEYPIYNKKVKVVATHKRDQLLYVYEEFDSPTGPSFNPRWYKVDEGYAHTAYLQPVETHLNAVSSYVNPTGDLYEVTVPLTQSYRNTKTYGWQKLYRLYYQSTHWVHGVEQGPDGALWYKILDELLNINYYVLATHLRRIPPSELTPVSAHVPLEKKKVKVSIAEQRLWAFEDDAVVLDTKVSTGIPDMEAEGQTPTATPKGDWHVFSKMPVRHMGNGQITDDIYAYELPGVPWVSYFHEWGVAFHGTYWHDNYGNKMSHGCVNMKPEEAKWLYRWLDPPAERKVQTTGNGTYVYVY